MRKINLKKMSAVKLAKLAKREAKKGSFIRTGLIMDELKRRSYKIEQTLPVKKPRFGGVITNE